MEPPTTTPINALIIKMANDNMEVFKTHER
jgi:hypothetical protein